MVSILGAGGAIGSELVKELTTRNQPVRLVSRNPQPVPGAAEVVAADLSNLDDTVKAVSGSKVAFLLVGLKYDVSVWRALWPRIMGNTIEAAKRANASLSCAAIFLKVLLLRTINLKTLHVTPTLVMRLCALSASANSSLSPIARSSSITSCSEKGRLRLAHVHRLARRC